MQNLVHWRIFFSVLSWKISQIGTQSTGKISNGPFLSVARFFSSIPALPFLEHERVVDYIRSVGELCAPV
jgi:hypothetical protein